MPTQITDVVQHLCKAVLRHDDARLTDGQLLGRFIEQRDEAAIAALVRRHGPMVWGVCLRILRTHHDAEDAFQATFLVLLRKAGSVRKREMVGNWLYGVAHQTALKARQMVAKKSVRERQVMDMPEPAVKGQIHTCDLQAVLDQELSRLPDKYRIAIVLCDLEGMTRKTAARQLGLPEGTLAGRLTRGRAMLARRLGRNGLAVSGGALATVLAQHAASAAVPTSVIAATMKTVSAIAAGQATAGLISAKVASLTDGMVKAMFLQKLKSVVALLLIVGIAATGASLLICHTAAGQGDQKPPAEKSVAPAAKHEKEGFTAWGNEVGGLQAGLGFRPGEHRVYHHGETVKFVLRVRNVGKEAVDFKHIRAFFVENPPKITDANGKMVQLPNYKTRDQGLHTSRSTNVAPGKEVELYEWAIDLQPNGEDSSRSFIHGSGKFSLQCERIVGPTWLNPDHPNPTLTKLATGKLELEVKSDSPPAGRKTPKQKQDESLTAWGKEAGGLQAGLSIRPHEKRVYRHGEVITLVVRVRNVSKQTVKFEYVRQFLDENLPTVTSADGTTVKQLRLAMLGFHEPTEVSLEPGKEIELESRLPLRYELRPTNLGDEPTTKERHLFVGTGKVSFQYDQVFGNSSAGAIKLAPALSNLGTGKVELEIKSDPPAVPEKKVPQKQEPGDPMAKKFWAGMSVNQPLFRAGQNTNLLQFNFALINESDKVVDPKIPGYPRLVVNGKELDLSLIPGVGLRDARFKALPPGDNLQFGMAAGQFFEKPGVYRVYWQGEEYRSNEVVFQVIK